MSSRVVLVVLLARALPTRAVEVRAVPPAASAPILAAAAPAAASLASLGAAATPAAASVVAAAALAAPAPARAATAAAFAAGAASAVAAAEASLAPAGGAGASYAAGQGLEAALTGERIAAAAPAAPSVTILWAPFGAGHEMAAKALAKAYEARGSRVKLVDVSTYAPAWQRRLALKYHFWTTGRFPLGMEIPYQLVDRVLSWRPARALSRALAMRGESRLVADLAADPTDHIVSTYLPLPVLDKARKEGRLRAKYGVVVTDWTSHATWIQGRPDRYYVAGPRVAEELAERGVPAEKIAVTGIPVDPLVAGVAPIRSSAKPTALVMMGGYGAGPLKKVVRSLSQARGLHLVIVAGRNPKVQETLARLVRELGLDAEVRGFVPHDELLGLMAGSDMVISKAGGVTVTEAQALGKPLILVGPALYQERGNAAAVVDGRAGVLVEPARAGLAAALLAENPELAAGLGRQARRLANPRSAADIVDDLSR